MTQTAKEYAIALFKLAVSKGEIKKYGECLSTVYTAFKENGEYVRVLNSPAILLSERLNLIEEAFGSLECEYIVVFLKLLCENGHIEEVFDCINEYKNLLNDYENKIVAKVYYASELSNTQKAALNNKLSELTKKTVEAVYIEDKTLIGGIKVEVDGKTLDGSVSARLNKVKGVISE